mmetsp:Transcript_29203/g.58066  ORF Transcript_29203/g.58066 Transcript_29203/m.58066 type:complete len:92 (-) Transcript_29203:803-1078(-)
MSGLMVLNYVLKKRLEQYSQLFMQKCFNKVLFGFRSSYDTDNHNTISSPSLIYQNKKTFLEQLQLCTSNLDYLRYNRLAFKCQRRQRSKNS